MSATMYGSTAGAGAGQAIFTDDVSLQVFMEHLKRLVRVFHMLRNFVLIEGNFLGCWRADELECYVHGWIGIGVEVEGSPRGL